MDAAAALASLVLKGLIFFGLHTTSEALRSDGLHQLQQLQFDPFNVAVFLILFDLAQAA
jgi:divalent metal cation (Fe/Co/Zn/Cd) transporter